MKRIVTNKITLIIFIDFVLYLLLPLEFGMFQSRNIIYPLIWISLPIIFKQAIPKKKSTAKTILLIFWWVGYLVVSCLVIFVLYFFCGWINYGAVYKSKTERSLKLVCKSYECYGTSGDCDLYKQRRLAPNIFWVTKFSEKKVDSTLWDKIPFGE